MRDEKEFERIIATWLGDEQAPVEMIALTKVLDELYADGPETELMVEVQEKLYATLAKVQLEVLYYDILEDSPVGSIFISVGEKGVVGIEIGVTEVEFVSRLERKFHAVVIRSPEKVSDVKKQLREYFEGKRSSFKLKLYLDHLTQFQQQVLLATLGIPHGQITTYGEMARRLGKVQLARAVGQALARNPIPIVIPCHRVLAADGTLHGYSGGRGLETKEQLLRLEGAISI
jgi:methylated-DNA-[protein]-cysteine S-methyltransferase